MPVAMFSGTSYSADLEVIIIQLDFFKVMIQRLFLNIFYLVNEGREGNPRSNPRYDQTFTQFTLGLSAEVFDPLDDREFEISMLDDFLGVNIPI